MQWLVAVSLTASAKNELLRTPTAPAPALAPAIPVALPLPLWGIGAPLGALSVDIAAAAAPAGDAV